MVVLSDAKRKEVWELMMRQVSGIFEPIGTLTKAELRTAVNDIDSWVDSNAVSFNNAIQQPARSALTKQQKALILMYVVTKRFEEDS